MSKEKTLTAEEKLYTAFFKTFHVNPKNIYDVINLRSDDFLDVIDNLIFIEQENAQAKVLEALEKEVPKAYRNGVSGLSIFAITDKGVRCTSEMTTGEQYYETEVKPKYK